MTERPTLGALLKGLQTAGARVLGLAWGAQGGTGGRGRHWAIPLPASLPLGGKGVESWELACSHHTDGGRIQQGSQ